MPRRRPATPATAMNALDSITDTPGLAWPPLGAATENEALRCHKPGPVPDDDEDDDEEDDRGSSGGNIDPDDDEGDFDDEDEDDDETLWTRRRSGVEWNPISKCSSPALGATHCTDGRR